MENQTTPAMRGAIEWLESIASAVAVILIVFIFVFQPARVDGASMLPTLQDGDKILLRSAFYTPKQGDIVVVDSYNNYDETLVKRVIAVGGDTIDIDGATGEVWVNGIVLDEPYILAPTIDVGDVAFPITVPQGSVFVMGDNRPGSLDSRFNKIGMIDARDIMGKVFFRLMPRTGGVK